MFLSLNVIQTDILIFRVLTCFQISTSALQTLTAATSMRCVAILWDPTRAPVKQDTQAMGELAMVRFVSFCFVFLEVMETKKQYFESCYNNLLEP